MCSRLVLLQFLLLAITASLLVQGQPAGISSKLDFGSESEVGVVSGIKGTNGLSALAQRSRSNVIKLENQDAPLENIGIVCVSGSCNTTKTTTIDSKEGVLTDVTVHVQTKVDLPKNSSSNKNIDASTSASDVPIVVGYGSSSSSASNKLTPELTQSVVNVGGNTRVIQPPQSDSFQTINLDSNPVVVSLEEAFPETRRRSGLGYVPTPNSFLDNSNSNSNNANTGILRKPLFTSTRDENFLYHPKQRPVYNPVEFKNIYNARTNFNTLLPTWQSRSYHQHQPNSIGNGRPLYQSFASTSTNHINEDGTVCTCQNHNNHYNHQENPGLRWYPTISRSGKSHRINPSTHQAHIDDKLAPLN